MYYKKRKPLSTIDYEEAYWGTVTDPDGNVRNRLEERNQHLTNIKQELNFIKKLTPGKILDVGCGLGFFLSALDPEWKKYGIEISQFAAAQANKYGKIFLGDLSEAQFLNNFFDVIFTHHVIEHVPNPEVFIKEIHRILKPGGHLILATPDFDSGCARRFGKNYRLLNDPTHISLFTNESMHRFLRDFDFNINSVEYPFFDTPYFTKENLIRLFDTSKTSPPFYGNFMTFYCQKPPQPSNYQILLNLNNFINQNAIPFSNLLNSLKENHPHLKFTLQYDADFKSLADYLLQSYNTFFTTTDNAPSLSIQLLTDPQKRLEGICLIYTNKLLKFSFNDLSFSFQVDNNQQASSLIIILLQAIFECVS